MTCDDGEDSIVECWPGEGDVDPGDWELVSVEVLVQVPGLEGGAEEGGGHPHHHPGHHQHDEVGGDGEEYWQGVDHCEQQRHASKHSDLEAEAALKANALA